MAKPEDKLQPLSDNDEEVTTAVAVASLQQQVTSTRLEQDFTNRMSCRTFLQQQVQRIAMQAREQYEAMACVVAIQSRTLPFGCSEIQNKDLSIVACVGDVDRANLQQVGESEFRPFHYNVRRKLPLIISDAAHDKRLEDHPLVKQAVDPLRFYASAPVVLAEKFVAYVGAVTIIDCKPRYTFSIDDGDKLMQKAKEVANILSSF